MPKEPFRQQLRIDPTYDGSVWRMSAPPGNPREHVHDELEFNLIVGGDCRYLVNGTCLDLAPLQLLWLFPDEPHVLVRTSSDFCIFVAVFRCERWKAQLSEPEYRPLLQRCPDHPQVCSLPPSAGGWLQELCTRITARRDAPGLMNAACRYLLLESWRLFLESEAGATGRRLHPAVFRASMLLRSDAERSTLEALADRAGLSPSRLSVLFSQQVGMSITEYRNRQCFRRYQELKQTAAHANLLELALEAGFGSYAQFHRIHRRLTGRSPRDQAAGNRLDLPTATPPDRHEW